ncbi:uncharacterized protein LOC134535784 [Bacillus rossius redtenbacheri]|uniref:uncharacterized protein LOC134535784 n=1 Tax=Bacillus rossius redtenbacheri TaxID=93214 RepID=UPI002FDEB01B
MDDSVSAKVAKTVLFVSSGVALGGCAYAVYRYWKKRESKCIDEGFEDVSRLEEENSEKRVLVLGLEGAGKSTILAQLTSDDHMPANDIKPTEGFKVTSLSNGAMSLNIWEIGGRESVRRYWGNFLQDTDLLVFVVDAADAHNLSRDVKEVKTLLGDERLAGVPMLVVANKQDKTNALSPQEVADALDLNSIAPSRHRVCTLGAQTVPGAAKSDPSISEFERVLFDMCSEK